jgi:hypothetical protein
VFHYVSYVHFRAVNSGFFEGAVEEFARGTNERMPSAILLISGLLANQHDAGVGRAFTEYSLGRCLP